MRHILLSDGLLSMSANTDQQDHINLAMHVSVAMAVLVYVGLTAMVIYFITYNRRHKKQSR